MNIPSLKKVGALLSNYPDKTFKAKELARQLSVKKVHYTEFRDNLKVWAAQGRIAKYKRNLYGEIRKARTLDGELHVKTQGYGFLITEAGQEDVFISQKNMGTAFNKDTVRVQLYATSKGQNPEGRVIEVVERARQLIVGTYKKDRRYGFVIPDEKKITRDIFVVEENDLSAKSGQKVVVKITKWQDQRLNPEGQIVEVLGFPDEPGVDVMSVVKAFDLPTEFPAGIEKEAETLPVSIPPGELAARLDLRAETCFTIDPADAKDFDDALSIMTLDNGNFKLGVHIADVSFYVRENTRLDKEALKRGASVYLVDRVIPMLPEKLSNQVCSLRPDEDRLTFSCFMEVTPAGEVVDHLIRPSVIHSKKRFTYQQAQEIINSKASKSSFKEPLQKLYLLSQVLAERRRKLGSLDFDLPEAKIELDDSGVPVAIKKQERLASHRLVEECMLLANETVTRHITVKMKEGRSVPPFIYRIHEEPDSDKMDDFKKFVKALGYPLDPNKRVTAKLIGRYLVGIKGKPEAAIVENLLLRSMMKAKYSIQNLGHFGLAFRNYTHFTSPIRRYPDLVVHRLLREYLTDYDAEAARKRKHKLESIAKVTSEREIVALQAERESIKLKKVEYMKRHLGDIFEGLITGVVAFGIFVEITDLLVEGLVHISDLADDYYTHDDKNYRLVGKDTGQVYRLGDPVKVQVVRVDADERVVDFVLVG